MVNIALDKTNLDSTVLALATISVIDKRSHARICIPIWRSRFWIGGNYWRIVARLFDNNWAIKRIPIFLYSLVSFGPIVFSLVNY